MGLRDPSDPCLRSWRAVCQADWGYPRLAEDVLRSAGEPAKDDPALAAELYAALAWAWLISDDPGVLVFAAQAARRAAEFDSGDLHHWLLETRIAYARGRMREAFWRAMDEDGFFSLPESLPRASSCSGISCG